MKLRALLVAAQSLLCEAVQARRGVIRFLYLVADLTEAACRERRWELLTQHGSRFAESFASENPCLGQEERGHVFSQNLEPENPPILFLKSTTPLLIKQRER